MNEQLLKDYVATVQSGDHADYDSVNAKFPEFNDVDPQILKDYVATVSSGNYGSWSEVNAKFPEFSSVGAYGALDIPKAKTKIPDIKAVVPVVDEPNPLEKNITNNKVKDIFDINNSITDKNEKAQKIAAESYFNLDKLKRPLEEYDGESDFRSFKNDEQTDIKNFFSTGEGGVKKYEEYLKYQETGELPESDDFVNILNQSVRTEKRKGIEAYISNLDEDEVDEAILNMPDLMNMPGADAEKIEQSFLSEFPEDSYYRRLYEGKIKGQPQQDLTYVKKMIVKNNPKKALQWEANYMSALGNEFTKTKENYEKELTSFKTNNKKILDDFSELDKKRKELGNVTVNSDVMIKTMYNDIVTKQQVIQETMKERGIFKLQDSLIAKQKRLQSNLDDLIDKSEIFDNKSMATEALVRDYSHLNLAARTLENFAQGASVLGLAALTKLSEIPLSASSAKQNPDDTRATSILKTAYRNAVNHKEELGIKLEADFPLPIKADEITKDNVWRAAGQMFANNSPSILIALGTMGYGTVATRGLGVAINSAAHNKILTQGSRMAMAAFGLGEGGGKLADMEILQKYAGESLKKIKSELYSEDGSFNTEITNDRKTQLQADLVMQERALNYSQWERGLSAFLYGGTAAYAEKLGTLGYLRRLQTMKPRVGASWLKSRLYNTTQALAIQPGIEIVEETATQFAHNFIDIQLGEDRSMVDGIDKDFALNTIFTSLAIQGPTRSVNMYNGIKSAVSNRKERQKSLGLTQELINVQETLDDNKGAANELSKVERTALVQQKRDLIEQLGMADVLTVQKVARMKDQDIRDLFDIDRQQRKVLRDIRQLGGQNESQTDKKLKQELIDKYNSLDAQKEFLTGKPQKLDETVLKEFMRRGGLELGVDVNPQDIPDIHYQMGKYQALKNMTDGASSTPRMIFEGENAQEDFNTYLDKRVEENTLTQAEADKLKAREKLPFAAVVGGQEVLFQDEIYKAISSGGAAAKFAAVAPLHELTHKWLRSEGVVTKDGEIADWSLKSIQSIEGRLNEMIENNLVSENDGKSILKRIKVYKEGDKVDLEEMVTLLGDLKNQGIIDREQKDIVNDLKIFFGKLVGKSLGKVGLGDMNMFMRFDTFEDISRYIDSFQQSVSRGAVILPPDDEVQPGSKLSEAYAGLDVDLLIEITKTSNDSKQIKDAQAEIIKQFDNLALNALGFDSQAGDIKRANVVAEARKFLVDRKDKKTGKIIPGILNRFDPTTAKFSTFVDVNMRPKRAQIYELAKTTQDRTAKKLDAPEVKELEGDVNETTNTEDTFVQKIDVLGFATVGKLLDQIASLVKVKRGDTFKQIIQKFAGKVGEVVFDIPAKKIMEGGANLTAVRKYEEGMPIPSEGQNIQKFFNAGNNAERFIKILPPTNVTSKTADINKIGENIDVSRNVYGLAIGLKGLPLNYFYKKTGKRSQGLTSQTGVFELKDKFKNPTPEVIEQFKQDLGITPKLQDNVYSRDIGQLLKGVAKVYSINAALSLAQRALEAKTEAAPVAEKKAIKQQTADITAAQSKTAFSENVIGQFDIEVKLDDLLIEKIGKSTYKLNTRAQVDEYIKALKKHVLPLMPRDFWFGQPAFIDTAEIKKELERFGDKFYEMYNLDIKTAKPKLNKVLKQLKNVEAAISKTKPKSVKRKELNKKKKDLNNSLKKSIRELDIKTWGTEFTPGVRSKAKNYEVYQTYYKPEMQKLRNLPDSAFGEKVDGVKDFSRQAYSSIFKDDETIKANIANGKIEEFNKKVGAIHKALWDRINATIRKDKSSAAAIGNYLKLTASQSNHWHKLGAEFVGYSPKPAGKMKGGNLVAYEYEHAMPATAAYVFLLDAALNKDVNFDVTYQLVMDNYKLIALDSAENAKLAAAKLGTSMPKGWNVLFNNWYDRYFNIEVAKQDGGIDPNLILDLDGKSFADKFNVANVGKVVKQNKLAENKADQALIVSSKTVESKGISILDFDDTLATSKSLIEYTKPDGTKGTLTPAQYASTYESLLGKGYEFDFSQFNKVIDGKTAPLFQKALKLAKKFGTKNMFVLTARPAQSAVAIQEFLKANGLDISLDNITGLANSTSEAKALWVAEKVGLGYNDFYFADDALQNVQAVKNILDQFDVKSKVQQAKTKFSESLSVDLNKMIEVNEGIGAEKVFSSAEAALRGAKKGKMRFYIPPGAEDFMGLMYIIANAKGKKGEDQIKFFEDNILKPYQKGVRKINSAKQLIQDAYKSLLEEFPELKKGLRDLVPGMNFTIDAAVRVYLWDKAGFDIPDISKTAKGRLIKHVESDSRLMQFADGLSLISRRKEGYTKPEVDWVSQTILSDLDVATNIVGRKEFLNEFIENIDATFTKENLSKLEAVYGLDFVEALQDMIYRMKTGKNRNTGSTDRQVARWTTWIQNSVGAIMFLNMRSALLQTISAVNFVNWSDNNPVKAAAALANLPQWRKDFSMIFNSDFLKQRRSGLRTDVNEAALANAMAGKKNKVQAVLSYLLKKGFTPTQVADSFAIASGGATFYRNRVNTYLKQGLELKEAETKAFADMQAISEVSQQSADPSLISKQQASILGRFILAFQNTPMQYARLTKKAAIDLIKGRGDWKSNVSKIVYYAAVQNIIFSALQSALFALAFQDTEEEEKDKKISRLTNTVVDSLLRGTGIYGAVVSTAKNIMLEFWKQDKKDYRADHAYTLLQFANISPPIGSKLRKMYSSTQTRKFNKDVMKEVGFSFDNPIVPALGTAVEAFTNLPLGRAISKINNARAATQEDVEMWQRMALLMGWNTWDLGVDNKELESIRKRIKQRKKNLRKRKKSRGFGSRSF